MLPSGTAPPLHDHEHQSGTKVAGAGREEGTAGGSGGGIHPCHSPHSGNASAEEGPCLNGDRNFNTTPPMIKLPLTPTSLT